MTITSFWFLAFLLFATIIYYLIPPKCQWIWLLALSVTFYCFNSIPYTIIYLVISTLIAYFVTFIPTVIEIPKKIVYRMTMISIVALSLLWFLVKGRNLWRPFLLRIFQSDQALLGRIDSFELVAALGMGYYTLQIIGYIVDCYWGNVTPLKNPLKVFLFISYFPQLITGPISRYEQLEQIFKPHKFRYENICFGSQRILWGFFKKLVFAERVGIIVSGIVDNPLGFRGLYSWMALLLYPLQMYSDFSGCMDIVLGVSELFGIMLPENFNNPFLSKTSQEFWQRWHITLGLWAKTFVLYPLLKSEYMIKLNKKYRALYGKKIGGYLTNCIAMFVLWMVMGIWHGGLKYIVGVSLWYWIVLMIGNIISPYTEKLTKTLGMKTSSFGWHFFQSIRTYFIYSVGAIFFLGGIKKGFYILYDCAKVLFVKGYINPWILFDESILHTGITYRDINIIILGGIIIGLVAFLRERYKYARFWVKEQPFVLRWFIWLSLFAIVLVYGKYGPGYSASEFIYQGF